MGEGLVQVVGIGYGYCFIGICIQVGYGLVVDVFLVFVEIDFGVVVFLVVVGDLGVVVIVLVIIGLGSVGYFELNGVKVDVVCRVGGIDVVVWFGMFFILSCIVF